jgi:ribosomal protein S18 acetylase RimI-like enzyme
MAAALRARVRAWRPKVTTSVVYARPLPLVPEERPDAGPDFAFKVVYDPEDRHLAQLEPPARLERLRAPMAQGLFAILAIHLPTDRAIGKIWVVTHTPASGDWRAGIPGIRLARDECYLLDLWIEKEFRRQAVAMTLVYELSAYADSALDHFRWVYCTAHKDNTASRQLFELFFGLWCVQQVTTVDWRSCTVVLPWSDRPRFGPFSKRGRHGGVEFDVPGRGRGEDYRPYHHPDGFARQVPIASVVDDWPPPGKDWFDDDPALATDGEPGTPATAPRARQVVEPS